MDSFTMSKLRSVDKNSVLSKIGEYLCRYGSRALLIASEDCFAEIRATLKETADTHSIDFVQGNFSGECSYEEIKRLTLLSRKKHCAAIIGWGDHKALGTAKAVICQMKQDNSTMLMPVSFWLTKDLLPSVNHQPLLQVWITTEHPLQKETEGEITKTNLPSVQAGSANSWRKANRSKSLHAAE